MPYCAVVTGEEGGRGELVASLDSGVYLVSDSETRRRESNSVTSTHCTIPNTAQTNNPFDSPQATVKYLLVLYGILEQCSTNRSVLLLNTCVLADFWANGVSG